MHLGKISLDTLISVNGPLKECRLLTAHFHRFVCDMPVGVYHVVIKSGPIRYDRRNYAQSPQPSA